jgi:hypothetical protein
MPRTSGRPARNGPGANIVTTQEIGIDGIEKG